MKNLRITPMVTSMQKILPFCVILLPALVIAFILIKFSVNVPVLDQWITPGFLFQRIDKDGSIGISDLLNQHNESRLVFPRIFFLLLAYLTHWNVQYEILATFVMACQVAINIILILKKTIKNSGVIIFLAFVMGLLIFSLAQYENWMWGIQIVYFVPILSLTTGIIILYSDMSLSWKVILLLLLSTFSTFSYSNGMLCWVLFPLSSVLISQWKSWRQCQNTILVWSVIALLNLGLYFWDYHKPLHHPSLTSAFINPLQAWEFVLAFLGSPLSGDSMESAMVIGRWTILVFLLFGVIIWNARNRALLKLSGGWITIATYSFLSAVITAVGRLGFGMNSALSPRYTTFSLYWYIALLGLLGVLMEYLIITSSNTLLLSKIIRKSAKILLITIPSIFLFISLLAQPTYINLLDYTVRNRLYAISCLSYIDYVDNTCVRDSLFPVSGIIPGERLDLIVASARRLEIMTNERFVKSPLLTLDKQNFVEGKYGYLDTIKKSVPGTVYTVGPLTLPATLDSDIYLASGWSILPDAIKIADSVLLAYQVESSESDSQNSTFQQYCVFAVSSVQGDRPDVVKDRLEQNYLKSGWLTQFKRSSLPNRKIYIRAWAYDTRNRIAYPLTGSQILDAS